jgi:hypothetical protein
MCYNHQISNSYPTLGCSCLLPLELIGDLDGKLSELGVHGLNPGVNVIKHFTDIIYEFS